MFECRHLYAHDVFLFVFYIRHLPVYRFSEFILKYSLLKLKQKYSDKIMSNRKTTHIYVHVNVDIQCGACV